MPRAIELLREIGFPLLLLLLMAVVIVLTVVCRVWRTSPRFDKLLIAMILLGAMTFVVTKAVSPTDKYAIGGCRGPGLRWFGISDEYYQLSDGVLYDVVDGRRQRMGSYYEKNGKWIVQTDLRDGEPDEQKLRFSVLGFDFVIPSIEGNEDSPTNFNRRRLIPFTKPRWMPEWLE